MATMIRCPECDYNAFGNTPGIATAIIRDHIHQEHPHGTPSTKEQP